MCLKADFRFEVTSISFPSIVIGFVMVASPQTYDKATYAGAFRRQTTSEWHRIFGEQRILFCCCNAGDVSTLGAKRSNAISLALRRSRRRAISNDHKGVLMERTGSVFDQPDLLCGLCRTTGGLTGTGVPLVHPQSCQKSQLFKKKATHCRATIMRTTTRPGFSYRRPGQQRTSTGCE